MKTAEKLFNLFTGSIFFLLSLTTIAKLIKAEAEASEMVVILITSFSICFLMFSFFYSKNTLKVNYENSNATF